MLSYVVSVVVCMRLCIRLFDVCKCDIFICFYVHAVFIVVEYILYHLSGWYALQESGVSV